MPAGKTVVVLGSFQVWMCNCLCVIKVSLKKRACSKLIPSEKIKLNKLKKKKFTLIVTAVKQLLLMTVLETLGDMPMKEF